MITIDPSYDIILTYSPIVEITGHVFECFDYYLMLRNRYKVGILFLDGMNIDQLKVAFESKYIVPFDQVENDIIMIKYLDHTDKIYKFGQHTIVILTDGNIDSLNDKHIFLATTKLLGFMCGNYNFERVKINNHIIYLQDYRIYGKNRFFQSYDYIKKLPFKYYRKSSRKYQNVGMMYVTYACRKITPDVVRQYHLKSGCARSLLVVPYKLDEYDNIDEVEQVEAPVKDFFDQFDTYIYTPVQRKFDCSPRLVTECFFHKKQILIDLPYVDCGLQTRYTDCKNDISKLDLTESDDIIKIIDKLR